MKRLLLNLLTALSLLLFVAVVALWVRSHVRADRHALARLTRPDDPAADFAAADRYTMVNLRFSRGHALVEVSDTWYPAGVPVPSWEMTTSPETYPVENEGRSVWNRLGFARFDSPSGAVEVVMPLWPLAVATALLPAAYVVTVRRRRRRFRSGHCRSCGYDLRATPGRCPECGRAAAANA